jgi:hypothetical protein
MYFMIMQNARDNREEVSFARGGRWVVGLRTTKKGRKVEEGEERGN